MLKTERIFRDSRLCRALLGIDSVELDILERHFEQAYEAARHSKKRQRAPGAGKKGLLPQLRHKLIFILTYLKCYPTYDVQGLLFGLERTRACRWVHQLLPVLEKALGRACVLPARKLTSLDDFFRAFPGARDVFIDGTERPRQKPKAPKHRCKTYSGKKKQTTRKVIVVTDEYRRIGLLSTSKSGRRHDKRLLDKADFIRHLPPQVCVWADTGFQGLSKQHPHTVMPIKASKKNPLTPEQKQDNRVISGIRVVVEHAIAGLKRLACMSQTYRNRKPKVDDRFAVLSAGLWNFHLNTAA